MNFDSNLSYLSKYNIVKSNEFKIKIDGALNQYSQITQLNIDALMMNIDGQLHQAELKNKSLKVEAHLLKEKHCYKLTKMKLKLKENANNLFCDSADASSCTETKCCEPSIDENVGATETSNSTTNSTSDSTNRRWQNAKS